jgi:hypothetical protein
VALTMLVFGIGAAVPLVLLGLASREAMMHWRGGLIGTSKVGKTALGTLLIIFGTLIVTGLDKLGGNAAGRPFTGVADELDDTVLMRCGTSSPLGIAKRHLQTRNHDVLGRLVN